MAVRSSGDIRRRRRDLDRRDYRRAAARLRQQNNACWICGEDIDLDLPYTDARSFTADHVAPVSLGGHRLGELRAAHRGCNARRGNRVVRVPTHNHEPGEGPERWGGRQGLPLSRNWWGAPADRFDANGYPRG